MQSSRRPMSIWARPIFVGLVALTLLASASVVVAAAAVPKGAVAAPVQPPVEAAVQPTLPAPFAAQIVHPTDAPSLVLTPESAPARHQVTSQPKTIPVTKPAPKPKAAPAKAKVVVKKPTASYQGVYHLWIPALGLSRGISNWGCRGGLIPNLGRVLGLRRITQPLSARPCLGCLRPDPRRLPLGRAEGRIDRLVRRQGRQGASLSDQPDPPCRQQGLCDLEHVGDGLVVEPDHHPPDMRRRDLRLPDPRSPGPCLTI